MSVPLNAMQAQLGGQQLATQQLQAALESQQGQPMNYAPTVDQGFQLGAPAIQVSGSGGPAAALGQAAGSMIAPGKGNSARSQTMQGANLEQSLMDQSFANDQGIMDAQDEYARANRTYQQSNSQRFRGGIGGAEAIYDMIRGKSAHEDMLAARNDLQQKVKTARQDERYEDALAIMDEVNPDAGQDAKDAMSRQYATGDMKPGALATTQFRSYIGITPDVNKVPRYVGGPKHGQPVYPGVDMTPDIQQQLTTETGYRKELNAQLKDFYTVDDSYARVQASHKLDTAAGNLGLIFGTMNMLDPGVSVRKDDYESVAATRGMSSGMMALWQKVMDGTTLTDVQKDQLLALSKDLHGAAQTQAQKTVNSYTDLAKTAGVDVESVIGGYTQRTVGNNIGPRAYNSEQEIYDAIAKGFVKVGDTVIINGQEILIEEDE